MYSRLAERKNPANGDPRGRVNRRASSRWRVASGLALAFSTVLLAACASDPSTSGDAEATAPSDLQSGGVQAADAVARFTAAASQGASSQVTYEGRSLYVTVGAFYQSAAGNRCRRVTVRSADQGSYATGVCRKDGVWRTVMVY
jgi:hypothetical protein